MKKTLFLLLFGCGLLMSSVAQDSLQTKEETTQPVAKKAKFVKGTFRSTRIINMQSVEMGGKGYLQFMISHHFGSLWNEDGGAENFAQLFGLNSGVAHTYLAFDYSPLNQLNIGVAATGNATFEGWLKIKLLRQQTGKKEIPVTVVWYSLANVNAANNVPDANEAWNRFSFIHQVLIARKFSPKLSMQLMPTMVHYNVIPYGINNENNVFSIGLGGRYALSDKKALTWEYSRQLNMHENIMDKSGNINNYEPNLLALGIEFFTGGHVFQFYIGNTTSASNIEQLSKNKNSFNIRQFAIGFQLNRSFYVGKN